MGLLAIFTMKPNLASAPSFDENKYKSEIPNKVKRLVFQFADLSQEKIAKIFTNKFRPMNLYKLCHMRGCDNMY